MTQVLLVEPDSALRADLENGLLDNGYRTTSSAAMPLNLDSGTAGFKVLICNEVALTTSALDLATLATRLPVIILSSDGNVRHAVQAMKLGAVDYLVYPLAQDELVATTEWALESNHLGFTRATAQGNHSDFPMLGQSEVMLHLFRDIRRVGPSDDPVLIAGEPGTGKELVAHALHAASKRQHAAMICVNCASIPKELIETELFGQEQNFLSTAITLRNGLLQAAEGGTLFLDKVAALPLQAQARLLNVLQRGEYRGIGTTTTHRISVRLIAASERSLLEMSEKERFRKDLLYHLSSTTLNLPPLRDRREDIPLLAEHLLERICYRLNRAPSGFSPDALQSMSSYHWPGNVREMENAIERAVILSQGNRIPASLLALETARTTAPVDTSAAIDRSSPASLENYFVQFVLQHQEELTETELAQHLGISRKSLWERRQRLNIPRKKTRKKALRRSQNHTL